MNSLDDDRALIELLGGPAKLAERLGYEKDGGVQRVQNWLARGIPAAVKLEYPDLFLPQFKPARKPQTAKTTADTNGKGANQDHAKAAKRTPREKRVDDRRYISSRASSMADRRSSDKPANRKGR